MPWESRAVRLPPLDSLQAFTPHPLGNQVACQACGQEDHDGYRDRLAVGANELHRLVAIPDRQEPFAEIPDAAPDRNGRREATDTDAGDAREKDEDLERRRRRQ